MRRHRAAALLWVLAGFLAGAWFPRPAHAFVPPAGHLLRMMGEALGRAPAFSVDQRVTVFSGGLPLPGALAEELTYQFPNRLRAVLDTGSGKQVRIVSGEKRLTVVDGRIVSGETQGCDLYADLLLFAPDRKVTGWLTSLGWNGSRSSLGRWQGRLVYVTGAHYPDTGGCQLWLDKETLHPVRWIVPPMGDAGADGALDIRYSRWQPVGGAWYPGQIVCYRDGAPFRQIDAERVEVAQGFGEALFDVDRLRRDVTAQAAEEPARRSPTEEVRQAIENFHRLYRP